MSEIIYAIIKEDEKSKLHKISISTNSQRTISDEELCKFHNYATKLLQKSEMRKDIVIELSYRGFSRASDYS